MEMQIDKLLTITKLSHKIGGKMRILMINLCLCSWQLRRIPRNQMNQKNLRSLTLKRVKKKISKRKPKSNKKNRNKRRLKKKKKKE